MSSNYAIEYSIAFDNVEHLCMYGRVCDDMTKAVGADLEMEVDEIRVDPDPADDRLQLTGTSDIIPGKRAFRYLSGLLGCTSVEMWYCGGDRYMGVVCWVSADPNVVRHEYLPAAHRPENDDMESMHRAYQGHYERETINVEDLWGYYAEEVR